MTDRSNLTWNPDTYTRFRGLRLRPAMDLVAQVPEIPEGDIVDLGCGNGAVAAVLAAQFPGRRLIGVDKSPEMLREAAQTAIYDRLMQADVRHWSPEEAPALIFSNAALHWIDDHNHLMPRLIGLLRAKGALAVQMPRQFDAPSHRLLRDVAAHLFPDIFDFSQEVAPVSAAFEYAARLSRFGEVTAWETEYVQAMPADPVAHPVRRFTESTAMLPVSSRLDPDQLALFLQAYDAALYAAYPLLPDGGVLFPFKRCFFVVKT